MKKGRDLAWYEDNAVVLSAMVRGKSKPEKLDIASMVAHLALAMLNCRVWFEYVESDVIGWMKHRVWPEEAHGHSAKASL